MKSNMFQKQNSQVYIDPANREIMEWKKKSGRKKGCVAWNKINDGLTKYQRYYRKHFNHNAINQYELKKENNLEPNTNIKRKGGVRKGNIPWNKGLPMLPHVKEILRISHIDFHHSDESKKKMSISQTGRKHTVETKKKMSLSKLGYTHTPETIEKMKNKIVSDHTRALIKEARKHQKFPKAFSKPERFAESILRINGVNCTMQKMELLGRPDIFIEPNICIFIDGDYVHGNPAKHKENDKVCFGRIAKDIWKNDLRITNQLISEGYKVIRIWTSEFYKNRKVYPEKIISLAKFIQNSESEVRET
jgi:G:T-mismatch repair DNA endonuclease (very short patch repair protein)